MRPFFSPVPHARRVSEGFSGRPYRQAESFNIRPRNVNFSLIGSLNLVQQLVVSPTLHGGPI